MASQPCVWRERSLFAGGKLSISFFRGSSTTSQYQKRGHGILRHDRLHSFIFANCNSGRLAFCLACEKLRASGEAILVPSVVVDKDILDCCWRPAFFPPCVSLEPPGRRRGGVYGVSLSWYYLPVSALWESRRVSVP